MRLFSLLTALGCLSLLGVAPATAEREARPTPRIEVLLAPPHEAMHIGQPFEVVATIRLAQGARGPFLLTPVSDGPAVEILRGRLSALDADEVASRDGATEARLRIPMLAHAAGDAVLRARLDAYGCERGRCHAIRAEATHALSVEP